MMLRHGVKGASCALQAAVSVCAIVSKGPLHRREMGLRRKRESSRCQVRERWRKNSVVCGAFWRCAGRCVGIYGPTRSDKGRKRATKREDKEAYTLHGLSFPCHHVLHARVQPHPPTLQVVHARNLVYHRQGEEMEV